MTKRLASLLFLLALCVPILGAASRSERAIIWKYNASGSAYTYCVMNETGSVGQGRIETSGSSATVTAVSGYTGLPASPFARVGVGDEITATSNLLTAPVTFTVIAWASATSITADRAINIDVAGGCTFTWRDLNCGTTATDGWFDVPAGGADLEVIYAQGDLTGGLDVSVEKRMRGSYGGASPDTLTFTLASAPAAQELALVDGAEQMRVGVKYNSADPLDTTTNIEQVHVVLRSER